MITFVRPTQTSSLRERVDDRTADEQELRDFLLGVVDHDLDSGLASKSDHSELCDKIRSLDYQGLCSYYYIFTEIR